MNFEDDAEAKLVQAELADPDRLFRQTLLLLLGGRARDTLSEVHAALADDVRVLAAIEGELPADHRTRTVDVSAERTMSAALFSFLRQDPDVVVSDALRTDEELELAVGASLGGTAFIGLMPDVTVDAAATRLRSALSSLRAREPSAPLGVVTAWLLHTGTDGKAQLFIAKLDDAHPAVVRARG